MRGWASLLCKAPVVVVMGNRTESRSQDLSFMGSCAVHRSPVWWCWSYWWRFCSLEFLLPRPSSAASSTSHFPCLGSCFGAPCQYVEEMDRNAFQQVVFDSSRMPAHCFQCGRTTELRWIWAGSLIKRPTTRRTADIRNHCLSGGRGQ